MDSHPSASIKTRIGFGCYGIPTDKSDQWIREAIMTGYRHFDCAFLYLNEAAIGKGLRHCIEEGLVKREDISITSKLPMNGMSTDKVNYFLHKSLESLDCDYLDLYLIHAPFAVKYVADELFYPVNPESGQIYSDQALNFKDTWRILEKAVDDGFVRSIGVSNFNETQIHDLIKSCRIKPSASQNETHIYFQQKSLRKLCDQHNINYQSFAPLGSPEIASALGLPLVLKDDTISRLAIKYKATNSQILLRWQQQMNMTPIVGFDNLYQIKENIDTNRFTLSPQDLATIEGLDKNERISYFDHIPGTRSHRYYPF